MCQMARGRGGVKTWVGLCVMLCVCDGVFVCLELFLTLLREYQRPVHKIIRRAIPQENLKGQYHEVSFRARPDSLSILGQTKTKNKYASYSSEPNNIQISKQNLLFL